jgi:sulfite exporter TauE/SafE
MIHPEGFILGLSTGAVCLAYCGPVLIPFLLGEGGKVKQNYFSLFFFMSGRLVAYLITGWLAGTLGHAFLLNFRIYQGVIGMVYMMLSLLMIMYGFHRFKEICLGSISKKVNNHFLIQWPFLVPMLGGILTGFNLCPPFLMAFAKAFDIGQVFGSVMLFFWFFLGTSVYFIPLPLIGFTRQKKILQIIGKFAAILAGLYYFYIGLILFIHR